MIHRILATAFCILSWQAFGQTFDAASVKPSGDSVPGVRPVTSGSPGTNDPGRIVNTRRTLPLLVMQAWVLQSDQISGPAWLKEINFFDVTATMSPDTTKEQFQLMLQNLLIGRVHMQVHHETRDFPGYELQIADKGSKLRQTTQAPDAPEGHIAGGVSGDCFPILPPGRAASIAMSCGAEHAKFQSYTIPELVNSYLPGFISESVGGWSGPLMDKTGLTAKYDFTLAFDARSQAPAVVSPNIPRESDITDPSRRSELI